jgi:hypothetical protein
MPLREAIAKRASAAFSVCVVRYYYRFSIVGLDCPFVVYLTERLLLDLPKTPLKLPISGCPPSSDQAVNESAIKKSPST